MLKIATGLLTLCYSSERANSTRSSDILIMKTSNAMRVMSPQKRFLTK